MIWKVIAQVFANLSQQPAAIDLPPLHINEDGWIEGEDVTIIRAHSSWYYPRLSTPSGDPLAIVAHCSDTLPGTGEAMARRRNVPRRPRKPEHKDSDVGKLFDRTASWHASVEADRIIQMVPFESGAWHAVGVLKGVGAYNRAAIGIELIGRPAGPWSLGYVHNAMRLWRALATSYGIPRARAMIAHSSFEKNRSDPGKEWMSKHAESVLNYAYAR
jgi:N-acetylmuramoyl-L-alanine amidase